MNGFSLDNIFMDEIMYDMKFPEYERLKDTTIAYMGEGCVIHNVAEIGQIHCVVHTGKIEDKRALPHFQEVVENPNPDQIDTSDISLAAAAFLSELIFKEAMDTIWPPSLFW